MNKAAKIFNLKANEAELRAQLKLLEEQRKALEFELFKDVKEEFGSYNMGDYVVDVKPRVRFSADRAKKVLSEDVYARICESKPSSTLAKSVLRGYEYEDCQDVVGTNVVIKEA